MSYIFELKFLLRGIADDVEVMIPVTIDEESLFISPDADETGLADMEDIDGKFESEPAFLIVPMGFYQEPFDSNLN